jgi:galactosamine-6-phosphate isomerase
MKIVVSDAYEDMSRAAAREILQLLQPLQSPLICIASGDTPAGLYREMVEQVNRKGINVAGWNYVGLDEWMGMNGYDEGSCRYYIDQQVFDPLNVPIKRIAFFDGTAIDPVKECERVEKFIQVNKGIDIAVLGLGMNGHIGMNEPGTSASLRSHISDLDPQTQEVGQKYFKSKTALTQGFTLGIATILEAKHIFLLVSGAKKASIASKMVTEKISEQLPCTLLRNHAGLRIYLDKEAGAQLPSNYL